MAAISCGIRFSAYLLSGVSGALEQRSGTGACHSAQAVGFCFERVILDHSDSAAEGVGYPARPLLHHVRQFVAEEKLSLRRVGVVLARREVQLGAPGERDGSNGRCLRPHMHPHIREAGSEGSLHLCLDIPWQRPSAGSRTEIDLKGIHAGAALYCRFRLDCAGFDRARVHRAGIDGGKGERTRLEESLYHAAPAIAGAAERWSNHWSRNSPKWRGRCHAGILPRVRRILHQFSVTNEPLRLDC